MIRPNAKFLLKKTQITFMAFIVLFIYNESIKAQNMLDNWFIGTSLSMNFGNVSRETKPIGKYFSQGFNFGDDSYVLFSTISFEVGRDFKGRDISFLYRYGKSQSGDISLFIDLEQYRLLGIQYREQFNRYRNSSSELVLNTGVRATMSTIKYSGIELIDRFNNGVREVDYSINSIAFESGIYLELGQSTNQLQGFFVNFEPFYMIFTNRGGSFGFLKVSGVIKF
jgi:hypothetical protein